MTRRRAWLPHPARTIHPPTCPTGTERFPTRTAAEASTAFWDQWTHITACPLPECGGWHRTPQDTE